MKKPLDSKLTVEAHSRSRKPLVSAKAKVLRFLSRREYAQEELRAKLLAAGYEAAEIQEALDWAKSRSFQSDERFALSLHRRRAARFGDRAIESELSALGLKGKLAELKQGPFPGAWRDSDSAFPIASPPDSVSGLALDSCAELPLSHALDSSIDVTLSSASSESPFLNKADLLPEPERAFQWMQRKYVTALSVLYAEGVPDKNELYKLKGKAFQALAQRGFEIRNIDVAWRRLIVEFNSDQ